MKNLRNLADEGRLSLKLQLPQLATVRGRLPYTFIAAFICIALLAVIAPSNTAAVTAEFQKRFDSLFIIASSGEVQYREMNAPAMDSIAAMGVDVVPILVDRFTTKSARERWTIIWTLTRVGSKAVPYLVESLQRRDWVVVERVCWALGDIKDTSAVVPLIGSTRHTQWQVRDQAYTALGKIADRRAGNTAVSGLKDSIPLVRKSATVAIGKVSPDSAMPMLIGAFADPFYGVRMTAIDALFSYDTLEVIQHLTDSIGSSNASVADLVCFALGRTKHKEVAQTLLGATASPTDRVRASAIEAIIAVDPADENGYRKVFLAKETNLLVKQRIESAIAKAQGMATSAP
jgi:HEAT repeat protein